MSRRSKPVRTADERLDDLPIEALECRAIGHAWPRSNSPRMVLTPTRRQNGRVVEAERTMTCEGGCGRSRTEVFVFTASGQMYREGASRYRTEPGKVYLLKPRDPDDGGVTHTERVHRDDVRYALVTRLHPDLRW